MQEQAQRVEKVYVFGSGAAVKPSPLGGAPRSESGNIMIASGNHTLIFRWHGEAVTEEGWRAPKAWHRPENMWKS